MAFYTTDKKLFQLCQDVQQQPHLHPKYSWNGTFLRRLGKVVVGDDLQLRKHIFGLFHDSVWGVILASMLLVTGFQLCFIGRVFLMMLNSGFMNVLFVNVAKLTILLILGFCNRCLYWIVLDRSLVWISLKVYYCPRELFCRLGAKLKLSTAYHPQTDGQIEILNKCLESYLWCMTGEKPSSWASWLPLAEWWYNTTYHLAIQTTPYEALYGQNPLLTCPTWLELL